MTEPFTLRETRPEDAAFLVSYFSGLSEESRRRYGPHSFDTETVERLCSGQDPEHLTYIAWDNARGRIAAYTILKRGYLDFETSRYESYGLKLDHANDYTLAPSVGDAYQSQGLGGEFLSFILAELRKKNAEKILLWGGVQATNRRAYRFYQKAGFRKLGEFEHNGLNYDMVLNLHDRLMSSPSWLKDLIIYEINPYAFTSATRDGAPVPESGTLAAAAEKIDYLADIGITGIWLAGFSLASDHHFKGITVVYACMRPDEIDPRLGTREDLTRFIEKAHSRGIRVFLEAVTHGVVHDSTLVAEHPDWFKGSSWGMADYDYSNEAFREWWISTWTDYAVRVGADGFRLDGPNGVQPNGEVLQIWDEIVTRCGKQGKEILVMPENAPYHFQQGLQDTLHTKNAAAEFCDMPRFRCKAISNHDRGIDEEAGESFYHLKGSRYLLGYESVFSANIPLLMSGEEFKAEYIPLPGCRLGLFGDGDPCAWLYASWIDWDQVRRHENAAMLDDFRKILSVRRENSDLLHYDRLTARVIPVPSDLPGAPVPYLRYKPGGDAILVAGNDAGAPLDAYAAIPDEYLESVAATSWTVTDLWTGERTAVSREEMKRFPISVPPDRVKDGGVRAHRFSPAV